LETNVLEAEHRARQSFAFELQRLPCLHLGCEAKELEQNRLDHRRNVTNTLSKVPHKLVAIAVDHLGVLRPLVHGSTSLVRSVRNAQHSRPLLELFVAALRLDQSVGESVSDQESGAFACVAGICVLDKCSPLLGRVRETLRTGLVAAARAWVAFGSGQAAKCNARVGGAGLENLGVGADHDVGHHSARGAAHDEDLGLVGAVLLDGIVDHADDTGRITARTVGQSGGVVDVPAVAVLGGLGINQDVAKALG
jgi:hypothetical protein